MIDRLSTALVDRYRVKRFVVELARAVSEEVTPIMVRTGWIADLKAQMAARRR